MPTLIGRNVSGPSFHIADWSTDDEQTVRPAPGFFRRVLSARNDERRETTDSHARYFGPKLDGHSLTAGSGQRIAPTRFQDWLREFVAG
jgi:hypothetical protein